MRDPKPDFLIIGAPKAATTSLWSLLREQRGVFMTEGKEPRFFSHDENYHKGWAWYRSLFCAAPANAIAGDASPHYSMTEVFPETVERIATHLPEIKLIYCVRNPYTALPSAWRQYMCCGDSIPERNAMPTSFERALREWPPLTNTVAYWTNISAYRRRFRDEQILVVYYEDFARAPLDVVQQCLAFLGSDIPARLPVGDLRKNVGDGRVAYVPIVRRLRSVPGWDKTMRLFPTRWKQATKKRLRAPVDLSQIWTGRAVELVDDVFRNEGIPILEYTGRKQTLWSKPEGLGTDPASHSAERSFA